MFLYFCIHRYFVFGLVEMFCTIHMIQWWWKCTFFVCFSIFSFLLFFSVSSFSAQCTMSVVYLLGLTKRGLTNIGNYVSLWHSLPSKVYERPESREKKQKINNKKNHTFVFPHLQFVIIAGSFRPSTIHRANKKQNVFTWFTYFFVMTATVKNENDRRKRKKLFEGTIQTI